MVMRVVLAFDASEPMTHNLDFFRKIFRTAAILVTVVSAAFSWTFGYAQSPEAKLAIACGVFFIIISVCSDYTYLFVQDAKQRGDWGLAKKLQYGFCFLFALNLIGHIGSVGYTKKGEIAHSDLLQKTASVSDVLVQKSNVAIEASTMRLVDLEGKLKASEAWSVVVSPAGLNEQIKSLEGDRLYKRSKECANVTMTDSRAFCDKLAGLRTRYADVQVIEGLRQELKQQRAKHEALSGKSLVAHVEQKPSANIEQAAMFAGMATVSLEPKRDAIEWTSKGLGVLISLGLCIGAPLFSMIGWGTLGGDRKPEPPAVSPYIEDARARIAAPVQVQVEKVAEPVAIVKQEVKQSDDEELRPSREIRQVVDSPFARRVNSILSKRSGVIAA